MRALGAHTVLGLLDVLYATTTTTTQRRSLLRHYSNFGTAIGAQRSRVPGLFQSSLGASEQQLSGTHQHHKGSSSGAGSATAGHRTNSSSIATNANNNQRAPTAAHVVPSFPMFPTEMMPQAAAGIATTATTKQPVPKPHQHPSPRFLPLGRQPTRLSNATRSLPQALPPP